MKRIVQFCWIFGSIGSLLAQKPAVKWSEEFAVPGLDDPKIIAVNESGIFTEVKIKSRNGSSYNIAQFDRQMNSVNSNGNYSFYQETGGSLIAMRPSGEEIYSVLNESNKVTVSKMSLFSLRFQEETQEVGSIDCSDNDKCSRYFFHTLSPDRSKTLLYQKRIFGDQSHDDVLFYVLDDKLELMWEKEVVWPYPKKQFHVWDYKVGDNGNVCVLGILKEEKKGKIDNESYQYHLFAYYDQGASMNEFTLELEGRFITNAFCETDIDGKIHVSGFYSDPEKKRLKGMFYLQIDTNKEISVMKTMDIDLYVSNSTRINRPDDYKVREILFVEDGCLILAEERYFYAAGQSLDGLAHRNMMVLKLDHSGKLLWKTKVPKHQSGPTIMPSYLGYTHQVTGKYLYLLYNAHQSYLPEDRDPEIRKDKRKANVVMIDRLDLNTGERQRQTFFTKKEAGMVLVPRSCRQINEHEMIIVGRHVKVGKIGKVTFP